MKKLFLPFLFLLIVSSGTLPSTKGIIYHSTTDENVAIAMTTTISCNEMLSCGDYKDSVRLGRSGENILTTRQLTIQTHGNDIYGWSDGNVTYTIK